jgi:hypothetical protein
MTPDTSQARLLTKDFAAVPIAKNIKNDKSSTATKLGWCLAHEAPHYHDSLSQKLPFSASLITVGQAKLTAAQSIVDNAAAGTTLDRSLDHLSLILCVHLQMKLSK